MEAIERALITGGAGELATAIHSELKQLGMEVLAPGRQELDVADENSVAAYASGLEKIDLLICNAGCADDRLLARMPEASWDHVLEVNLTGAARCARQLGKRLKKGGSLIFIGSFSAKRPPIGQVAYAAAKAGLEGLTKSLAQEWGRRDIRVNLVMPGFIETKFTKDVTAERLDQVKHLNHLGRLNKPEDLARFVSFLHGSMPNTSGQEFNLDSRIF